MPEKSVHKSDTSLTKRSKWVTPVLIILLIAIFVICMVFGGRKTTHDGEGFGGTDDAAADAAEEAGAKQKSQPSPPSLVGSPSTQGLEQDAEQEGPDDVDGEGADVHPTEPGGDEDE